MPNYKVIDNQIHFRQSFSRDILRGLFVTLAEMEDAGLLTVSETGSKVYPYSVSISESEFLSVLEMIGG